MTDNLAYSFTDEIKPDLSFPDGDGSAGTPGAAREGSAAARPKTRMQLQYSIEDVPPWYLCIILGFQHYLTAFGALLSIPLIIAPAMCVGDDNVAKSELLATMFFVSGLVTMIQSTIGTRLPIVQGGSFSFLAPTFAIVSIEPFICPAFPSFIIPYPNGSYTGIEVGINETAPNGSEPFIGSDVHREIWQVRMREIQGAIILAALFQVVIGFSGLMGLLLKFIGPLAIAPTIALVGLSLFKEAADACDGQWWIAIMTIVLIILFSQYLRNVDIPCCSLKKTPDRGIHCVRTQLGFFRLFPVILGICGSWVVCAILTATGALPEDKDAWGYEARTDTKIDVLYQAAWFRFPYPFQWGMPTFSVASVFGMLAGVLAGMIESVGDYYACARLAGAPPPPVHAINRGIFFEGVGCILAGMWGTGNGTTSYSENIGAIGITKVGSRRVIQMGGIIMLLLGMLGKFGALFVTIPEPIIGGVFMVTFGMIAAVGISNLQFVDLNSSRNLFIVGFSIFFGLSLPQWLGHNPGAIETGNAILNQIILVLLRTGMFVGGVVGFFLDNTIPGTDEERGIKLWRAHMEADGSSGDEAGHQSAIDKCYDLPLCMSYIRRWKWTRFFPLCPTYSFEASCGRCCKRHNHEAPSVNDNHYQNGRTTTSVVNINSMQEIEKDKSLHHRNSTATSTHL